MNRFIILSNPRSGSNLLRYSLATHENIVCYGEIFNKTNRVWSALSDEQKLNKVFNEKLNYKAAGFSIHYYDLKHINLNNYKIIKLIRRNKLAAYVSEKIATKTKNYVIFDKKEVIKNQIIFNDIEFYNYMNNIIKTEKNININGVNIYYENLCNNFITETNKILQLLEVEIKMLKIKTYKMNPYPLHEIIINYDDAIRYIKNQYPYLIDLI